MSAAENDESTSKNVPWFKLDIADIQPAFREILEIYSRIPSEAVKPHIVAIVCIVSVLLVPLRVRICLLYILLNLLIHFLLPARERMADLPLPLYRPIQLPHPLHFHPPLLPARSVLSLGSRVGDNAA